MLRRLHPEQPASFAFSPANLEWAQMQLTKYPVGRQASAIIPLLWRAQEQEGWLTRPAIEYVADFLDMPYMRALEVATFYFMFQLSPVGTVAHIQICGTTPCMLRGSDDLIEVCKRRISPEPFQPSADGKLSWEEVECMGACSNAPMAQIGKDNYEDLSPETFEALIDDLLAGKVPQPGSRVGRFSSEPVEGQKVLLETAGAAESYNASVARAVELQDTLKRIDGTEVALRTPWLVSGQRRAVGPQGAENAPVAARPLSAVQQAEAAKAVKEAEAFRLAQEGADDDDSTDPSVGVKPAGLEAARDGKPDDLKIIEGIGPVLEKRLNAWGIFHFDQISEWGAEEVAFVDANVPRFKGRCSRDKWVEQAKIIVAEGIPAFLEKAKTNDY